MSCAIALIHNKKPSEKKPGLPEDYFSECDSTKTIEAIARVLRRAGHKVLPVEADRNLPVWFKDHPVDLAFNIAEGFAGEAREARVPALLELLEIPYTGSSVLALALALDKARSKQLFRQGGIPTPKFQLFHRPDEPLDERLPFPLIVKPNREGSGKGIWASSVVHNEQALRAQVKKVYEEYRQEILVEEFVEGTELTVGILGTDEALPVLEVDFSTCGPSGESFYSWRMKEFQGNKEMHLTPKFWCPARLSAETAAGAQAVAVKAAKALGTRDVARVDIRLTCDGIPYVLEVNPLPGLDPEESNLPLMAQMAGISYEALICRILDGAAQRSAATSFHPLSRVVHPAPQNPKGRELPDSTEKKGLRLSGKPQLAVRQSVKRHEGTRHDHSKEEHLGR